ncbi:hypothetical protein ACKVWC_003406 [Pyricularia oryzae]
MSLETVNNLKNAAKKPYLLFCTTAASGHFYPVLQIAEYMIQQGFEATIIAADAHRRHVTSIGAQHVALPPFAPSAESLARRKELRTGFDAMVWGLTEVVVKRLPLYHQTVFDTLGALRRDMPGQQIIIMQDVVFMGANPFTSGAPLPDGFKVRPAIININVVPLQGYSIDVGPFGLGLPPVSTESGRDRNKALYWHYNNDEGPFASFRRGYHQTMESLGATMTDPTVDAFTAATLSADVTLQACSPSMEFPRSDLPSTVKFIGCLPCKSLPANYQYPEWWDGVVKTLGSERKKIIGVAQGTVALDYQHLIMPTIVGLADRDDVVVIAVLGVKGASLPDGFEVPTNAKVVDFLAYEALLPHTEVWVTNAGYGGFTQGVMHGVPMVFCGDTEDKADVSIRGEWAGVGYNCKTGRPTPEQIARGVDEVLSNSKYKERVMEIRKENEGMESLKALEKHVWNFAGRVEM